jgi:hypothetical protein
LPSLQPSQGSQPEWDRPLDGWRRDPVSPAESYAMEHNGLTTSRSGTHSLKA